MITATDAIVQRETRCRLMNPNRSRHSSFFSGKRNAVKSSPLALVRCGVGTHTHRQCGRRRGIQCRWSSPQHHGSARPLASGTDAKAWTCQGTEVVRPVNFIISCADAGARLTNTKWSSWTTTGAVGETTFALNLCKPYCAASKISYFSE